MPLPASLPSPRTPNPMDAPPLRWGIIAPGGIAGAFAWAANTFTRQDLVACGSSSLERAQGFAARYGLPRAYGSYEQLLADEEVQAVYVASPHSHHFAQAKAALEAGKHVLVEKSFTTSAAQARELAGLAAAGGLTLMEAMWTRFLPRTDVVRQLLEVEALGSIEMLVADHGQSLLHIPRLVDPELAGGALLDLGVYPLSWAVFALGMPARVSSRGTLTAAGVDRQEAIALDGFAAHPGAQALLTATIGAKTATTAVLSGTAGRIELPGDFYTPGNVRLLAPDNTLIDEWVDHGPHGHEAMCHEIAHFAQLVADGRGESPLLPLSETAAIVGLMDQIRAQLGVKYPWE
ncbi:MAG: Gfo/Idh/MocA family oxidoreductase [Promicromonosporaceae bacterium]|nr:Gfo/Idh/MocA family oxidoreductase [Promicromonosporaceae bacterium]